jgi:hypothetical protein
VARPECHEIFNAKWSVIQMVAAQPDVPHLLR